MTSQKYVRKVECICILLVDPAAALKPLHKIWVAACYNVSRHKSIGLARTMIRYGLGHASCFIRQDCVNPWPIIQLASGVLHLDGPQSSIPRGSGTWGI